MADEIETGASPAEPAVVETSVEPGSSVDAALDDAFDRVFNRDELGRFAPKEDVPAAEAPPPDPQPAPEPEPVPDIPDEFAAPPEWLNEAKDKWGLADRELRQALSKRYSEMEAGIARYREQITPFQGFFDMAKKSNVDPLQMVHRYVELDQAFGRDPMAGFEMIARSLGTDMRTIASAVLGKEAPPRDQEVAALRRQVAELTQKASAAETYMQREAAKRAEEAQKTIGEFAAKHPRFEELAPVIKWALETKLAPDLPTAYAYAERLNPSPDAPARTSAPAPADATARTSAPNPKTALSISGSPSAGSNPAGVPKSTSSRASIDYAFSKAGIG